MSIITLSLLLTAGKAAGATPETIPVEETISAETPVEETISVETPAEEAALAAAPTEDDILTGMSTEEKIAQMIMPTFRYCTDENQCH